MANSIEFAKSYTGILDEVYQRAAVYRCPNSGGCMIRAGRNAKEILIPKIFVTGLGDYTRNVGYKTGGITYEYETHSFGYDRAIRLFVDVMDVEESGVLDDFSLANPTRSNRVLERFSRIVEVSQVRFYTAIDLLSGDDDQFGYQKAAGTYVATTDTEVDSSKTYYTKSGDECTAVASPRRAALPTTTS